MRPNIVSEAGLSTRVGQWWEGIPFLTSAVVVVCGAIYLVCLLAGYDSFEEVCFWPTAVVSRFQVYRIFTSISFHGSLLHVLFNMLALVPLGSELERVMGSIRMLYIIVLMATSSAVFHLLIALLAAYNPVIRSPFLMNECAIGFSGVLFSMIVIETSLSGVQSRSVFGLFNVPAKWYAWILLVVFQLLMTNVSFLGHLSGILSGFAYTYGLFNFLIPGNSFYSAIESSSWLSTCVRRPKFIVCTGGNPSSYIPTYSSQNATSSGLLSGNIWNNLSSWMPQREASTQVWTESIEYQDLISMSHFVRVVGIKCSSKYGIIVIVVVVGYGYAWWKGWKLPDMMFATKRSLSDATNAVAKQLDNVHVSVSATKRHLSSRIDRVDCSLDECAELTAATKEEVTALRGDTSLIKMDVQSVHHAVYSLESKLSRIEGKQDDTVYGVTKLINKAISMENRISMEPNQALPASSSRPALEMPQMTSTDRASSMPLIIIEELPSSPASSGPPKVRRLHSDVSGSGLKALHGDSDVVEALSSPGVSHVAQATEEGNSSAGLLQRLPSLFRSLGR